MKYYPTYLQSFGIFLILLLCSVISALLVLPFLSLQSGIGMSMIYALSMATTIFITLRKQQDFSFGLKKVPLGLLFLACVSSSCIDLFLNPLTSLIPLSDFYVKLINNTVQHPVSSFIMIVVAAPILEELLFRGVILKGLLKNYSATNAIVFSAFFFGLVHGNWAQGIGAFILGLFIGWIYWKTRSVIPGIVIHLLNNLIALLGMVLSKEDNRTKNLAEEFENQWVYWLIVITAGLVASIGIKILNEKYFEKNEVLESA